MRAELEDRRGEWFDRARKDVERGTTRDETSGGGGARAEAGTRRVRARGE